MPHEVTDGMLEVSMVARAPEELKFEDEMEIDELAEAESTDSIIWEAWIMEKLSHERKKEAPEKDAGDVAHTKDQPRFKTFKLSVPQFQKIGETKTSLKPPTQSRKSWTEPETREIPVSFSA